jgi:hypothetical protein
MLPGDVGTTRRQSRVNYARYELEFAAIAVCITSLT